MPEMPPSFPKLTTVNRVGELGVNIVSRLINERFRWLFKRNHQEHDFGIDGYIEVVTPEGHVTGQLVAVQIKCGASFLREKNRWGYVYRGDGKHLNYLANYPLPVLLIICDPESQVCYWTRFLLDEIESTGCGWKTTIPFEKNLSLSKESVLEMLPPAVDCSKLLRPYWELSKELQKARHIHFVIDKAEIDAADMTRPRQFFDRLKLTRELAFECKGKVEISFHGYGNDPRELYEINEVRNYIKALDALLPELFFFIWSDPRAHALKLFLLCHSESGISKRDHPETKLQKLFYEPKEIVPWLERHWVGLNQMTEWLDMTLDENKSIVFSVMECVGLEVPPEMKAMMEEKSS